MEIGRDKQNPLPYPDITSFAVGRFSMRLSRNLLAEVKDLEQGFRNVDKSVKAALSQAYAHEFSKNFDKPAKPETFEGKVAATPELADIYLSVSTKLGKEEILVKPLEGNPTGLTDIYEHPDPRKALIDVYDHTLALIKEKFPPTSVYRTAVENMTQARRKIVENASSNEEIEQSVGSGLVEEILIQAADEFRVAELLAEHKVWEELEEKPLADQWVAHAIKTHEPLD